MITKLEIFRKSIIVLAVVSFLSGPLVLIASFLGAEKTVVEDVFYLTSGIFVYGLMASVMLLFIYFAMRDWVEPKTRSKIGTILTLLVGAVFAVFSKTLFLLMFWAINLLIHG